MYVSDRYIYIFCCASKECGVSESWRALRCQPAPPNTAQEKKQKPKPNPADNSTPTISLSAGADWGLDEGASAGDQGALEETNSGFAFGDLCSAFDALTTKTKAAKPTMQTTSGPADSLPIKSSKNSLFSAEFQSWSSTEQCLPSFYIHAELESKAKSSVLRNEEDDDNDDDIDEAGPSSVESLHSDAYVAGLSIGNTEKSAGGPPASAGDEAWEGEGYEADAVLVADGRTGADAAFLNFSKRLAVCPDQCARYGFGGELLWPEGKQPSPGMCARCGAPRTFEVQLMGPAISYMEESAGWIEGGSLGGGPAPVLVRPPPTWEWITVAVFSCSKSCGPVSESGTNSCFMEEQVFVANE